MSKSRSNQPTTSQTSNAVEPSANLNLSKHSLTNISASLYADACKRPHIDNTIKGTILRILMGSNPRKVLENIREFLFQPQIKLRPIYKTKSISLAELMGDIDIKTIHEDTPIPDISHFRFMDKLTLQPIDEPVKLTIVNVVEQDNDNNIIAKFLDIILVKVVNEYTSDGIEDEIEIEFDDILLITETKNLKTEIINDVESMVDQIEASQKWAASHNSMGLKELKFSHIPPIRSHLWLSDATLNGLLAVKGPLPIGVKTFTDTSENHSSDVTVATCINAINPTIDHTNIDANFFTTFPKTDETVKFIPQSLASPSLWSKNLDPQINAYEKSILINHITSNKALK